MSATPLTDAYLASRCKGENKQSWVEFAQWLEMALAESVMLQSHYAKLLNMHDGGLRRTFTAETWVQRLCELAPK